MKQLFLIACLIVIISCDSDNDLNIFTGIVGNVKYGIGDCMPIINGPDRIYTKYNGELYFIVKSDLENLGSGNFEQLLFNSIKTTIKDGKLEIELPIGTFLVMPKDVYLYSDYNTIIIKEGVVIKKDFNFWKCTSC